MEKLKDTILLEHFVDKYGIDKVFTRDMRPYMQLLRFGRNECICKAGEKLQYMYFHVDGKLKIYNLMDNGKLLLLRFNKPFNILGDVEWLQDRIAASYAESLNGSLLIGIPMEEMLSQAYDDPVFLRFIISNLSHKLQTISNATTINLLYPLENRFASYLLSLSMLGGPHSGRMEEIETTKLTEMATLLGTSYRHLHRIICKFSGEGIIKKEKKRITILNIERLRELAGENLYE